MNVVRRFSAIVVMISVLLGCCAVPVHAGALVPVGETALVAFGEWLIDYFGATALEVGTEIGLDLLVREAIELAFDSDGGSDSGSDHSHKWVRQPGFGGDKDGYKTIAYRCSVCGEVSYVSQKDIETAYDNYVDELPLNGYDSEGGFLWYPTASDIVFGDRNFFSFYYLSEIGSSSLAFAEFTEPDSTQVLFPVGDGRSLAFYYGLSPNSRNGASGLYFSLRAPVSGTYTCMVSPALSLVVTDQWAESVFEERDYVSSSASCSSGGLVRVDLAKKALPPRGTGSNFNYIVSYSGHFYLPVYKVNPTSALLSGDTYNTNTRTTTITGPVGYYNEDGELQVVENQNIVNEGDKTWYNPVTNTTYDMTGWSYDYSDRSYNITYDQGNATVIYGDQNITIKEGDTTYNVYYVIEKEAEPVPEHTHSYTGVVTTEPGCSTTGVKTYTCDECGIKYTETLPALGHDWQIKTQVQTAYDDDGNLVTQGYTIYKCSRCGEEYRTEDSVNPSPPAKTDDDTSLLDGLKSLRKKLAEFFETIPDMFGEFTDFLKAGFSYIPDEIITLMTFAVALAVLVGIFKLFWR